MNILITGATGLLGRSLYRTLSTQLGTDYTVLGTGFSRAKPPLMPLDLGDETAVEAFFEQHRPAVVIHAAAERKPDVCENDPAATLALNVGTSERLAALCTRYDARFFFISTDYVFDGKDAPYVESATTNPVNFYGRSKTLAEQAIHAISPAHTVIRVPVLYGEVETLGESAVTVIAQHVSANPHSEHDDWAIRYPTHVEDIALTIKDLVLAGADQCGGIFHISDNQAMTKYTMACCIAEILGQDPSALVALPEPTQTAARPYNCALKDTRLGLLGIHHNRPFADGIRACLAAHISTALNQ
jgi:S-adenosylmethionine synthetase